MGLGSLGCGRAGMLTTHRPAAGSYSSRYMIMMVRMHSLERQRRGLVLSGGGFICAFQAGAYEALGQFDCIAGVSGLSSAAVRRGAVRGGADGGCWPRCEAGSGRRAAA